MKLAAAALAILISSQSCFGIEPDAMVDGSDKHVAVSRQRKTLLLNAAHVGRAFDWEVKVVAPGKLLTFCREGDKGVCIPVRLENIATEKTKRGLFVDAAVLARTLRFAIEDKGGQVRLRKNSKSDTDTPQAPSYNASWGAGRGFRTGQTLPDIPLYDMDGTEVRFSRFLGKQYIIYCWASW